MDVQQNANGQIYAGGNDLSCESRSVLNDLKEKQAVTAREINSTVPVARLDFLRNNGTVGDSVEFNTEADFLKALKKELYYGVPLVIVLYRDTDGKTISRNFLEDLDTLPKGFKVEDVPFVQSHKKSTERSYVR